MRWRVSSDADEETETSAVAVQQSAKADFV
jgi:hypothetical protein